jgi:hypothetical protein
VAPFVGAAIHDWLGGSSAVFYLLAAAAVVAAVLVPFSMPTVQGPATTG